MAHTPGPWAIRIDGDSTRITAPPREKYGYPVEVADLSFGDTSGQARSANARIIAAAPELLAALERLEAALEDENAPEGKVYALRIEARAALAKARGEGR